jgi:putative MATE family efflux protein
MSLLLESEVATESEVEVRVENASHVVWALAWPAVALNSLQVLNTLLDRGFIGHLETAALTAHSGAMNVMFLMFSIAMAVSTGATALVSRAFGANDPTEYRQASRQSFRVALFGGIAFALLTFALAPAASAAILPKSDQAAIHLMAQFSIIYAAGLPAIWVIQTLAGSLRGIGDTKSPMVISGIQIGLHMLLNAALIFPPRDFMGIHLPGAGMGLAGAATALATSAWVSAIAYVIFVGRTPLGTQTFGLPDPQYTLRILRIAIPAALMACMRVFSLTAFTVAIALTPGGSAAIAAMGVAFSIESIMFMPSFGLSTAASALVGQSLGMKRPDRAEKLAWTAGHYSALVTVLLAGPVFLAAPAIAHVMLGGKTDVINHAVTLLRYLCATEVFFAYAMVMIGAMQGAGETKLPMWITIVCLWGIRVPMAFMLALKTGQPLVGLLAMPWGLGLGPVGAWIAISVTQLMQGVMSMLLFARGTWKTKRV